jgi:hypothetical protein
VGEVDGDGLVDVIVAHIARGIGAAMQLGVNGENWRALPAVQLPAPGAIAPALYSLNDLEALTAEYITDGANRNQLFAFLRQAQQAERQGHAAQRDRALASFLALAHKLTGTALTHFQAQALGHIAGALCESCGEPALIRGGASR